MMEMYKIEMDVLKNVLQKKDGSVKINVDRFVEMAFNQGKKSVMMEIRLIKMDVAKTVNLKLGGLVTDFR